MVTLASSRIIFSFWAQRPAVCRAASALLLAIAAIAATGCGGAPDAPGTPTAARDAGGSVGDAAPELRGLGTWINSAPLTMAGLRGKVVLVDFWTYTCVNCIRTLPYLRGWQERYADKGLVILGVHTPEFEFEKQVTNVRRAVQEFGLTYAVVQDNDYETWQAFDNHYWPAKYLIDKDGVVRYTHFGEGDYADTEQNIRRLLTAAGADVSAVPVGDVPEPEVDLRALVGSPQQSLTRELYGGFSRNAAPQGLYVAHAEYYDGPDRVLHYTDTGVRQNHFISLQGAWENGLEALRHARTTTGYEDHIAIQFFATSANAVITPREGLPFEVQVELDGRPVRQEEAGPDLVVEAGRSYLRIDQPRMYEVIALREFGGHALVLSANSDDFGLFAFTFGAYRPTAGGR